MKIGFSGCILDGGKSGIGTYIRELLKALSKVDHKNTYELLICEKDKQLVEHLNIPTKTVSGLWSHPISNILWHNMVLPFSSDDSILHIPDIRRIPLVKSCKLIATVHDLGPNKMVNKYGRMRGIYHEWFVPHCVKRCDHIICVSHATKRDLIEIMEYPEEKISVIYSGIDSELFKPLDKEEVKQRLAHRYGLTKPYFVYVSRIEHPAKNHYHLIKAFQIYKEKHRNDAQLVLAGALWNRSDVVEQLMRSSPYQQDIQFLGFVPEEDLPYLYNGCEAMVFPSLREGFGFPLLEAMASGAPVACSNTTSLKELGEGHAHLFDPLNPEEMAEQMHQAIGQSEEKRVENIHYAQSFKWDNTARQVMEVYEKVNSL